MLPSPQIRHRTAHTAYTVYILRNIIVQHISYGQIRHAPDCNYTKIVLVLVRTLNYEIACLLLLDHLVVWGLEDVHVFQLVAWKTVGVEEVVCVLDNRTPQDVLLGAWIRRIVPLKMGTLIPAILHEMRALVTTLGSVVLPATHVMPRSTLSYFLQISAAMIIQRASSPPTSQSMMKYLEGGILKSLSIFFLLIYIFELLNFYYRNNNVV